jgi:hypothetical protein
MVGTMSLEEQVDRDFSLARPQCVTWAHPCPSARRCRFGRAAAVVTDGGTLAAHASLVAREYGILAVVGTGEATRQLRDGQVVVDGGAGVVEMDR